MFATFERYISTFIEAKSESSAVVNRDTGRKLIANKTTDNGL